MTRYLKSPNIFFIQISRHAHKIKHVNNIFFIFIGNTIQYNSLLKLIHLFLKHYCLKNEKHSIKWYTYSYSVFYSIEHRIQKIFPCIFHLSRHLIKSPLRRRITDMWTFLSAEKLSLCKKEKTTPKKTEKNEKW